MKKLLAAEIEFFKSENCSMCASCVMNKQGTGKCVDKQKHLHNPMQEWCDKFISNKVLEFKAREHRAMRLYMDSSGTIHDNNADTIEGTGTE